MAIVKIFAEDEEEIEDIQDILIKSLSDRTDSQIEDKRFDDPLMNIFLKDMDVVYQESYKNMMKEIFEVLQE